MTAADILVIGGGIAGASAAYELAAQAKVILLERESALRLSRHRPLGGELHRELRHRHGPPVGHGRPQLLRDSAGGLRGASPGPAARHDHHRARRSDRCSRRRARTRPALRPQHAPHGGGGGARAWCRCSAPDYLADAIFEPDSRDIDVHGLHQGYLKALKTRRRGHRHRCGGRGDRARAAGTGRSGRAPATSPAPSWSMPPAPGPMRSRVKAGAEPIGLTPKRRTAFTIDPPAGVAIADWPLVNDVGAAFYFKPDAGQLLVSPADAAPSPPTRRPGRRI